MAQTAIQTRNVSSEQTTIQPYKAIHLELNFTSLSVFKACLMTAAIATMIWASVAYILMR